MKIFVQSSFKQQPTDEILYEYLGLVAIEVEDPSLYDDWRVELDEKSIEDMERSISEKLIKEVNALCDSKSRGVKVIIVGMEVSQEQIEEYRMVADAVDREDVSWFEDEAIVLGSTAQEEYDKAKDSKIGYEFAYNTFKKLIRLYRRWMSMQIKNKKFVLVKKRLEEGREIGVGLLGSPMEILEQSKEQVMQIISEREVV